MLPKYVDFMLEAGGETQFWSSGTLFFLGYGYAYFIVFWIVASIVAAVVVGGLTDRRSTARLVVSASVILGVTQFYALYRRPAGTTAFETASLLLAFAAIALACVSERRVASWFILASLAVWTVCCGWTFSWEANTRLVAESAPYARALWKLHDEILGMARGRPIVVIIPDNSFSHGGVHELLLKAAADFPTWNISSRGQWLINRYGPGLTFRHEHGGASPEDAIAQGAVVVWYDRPDKLPLKQRYRSIAAASERVGTVTRDWMLQMSGVTQAVAHASFAP